MLLNKPTLLLCTLFLARASAFGTAGVVIVTPDSVFIGADSVMQGTARGTTTGMSQGCKIRKVGNIFYLPVGAYGFKQSNYDVFDAVDKAMANVHSIKEVYAAVVPPITDQLSAVIEFNRKYHTPEYERWLHGITILDIVFATFEDVPVGMLIQFRIDANKTKAVSTGHPFKVGAILGLGNNDEMNTATNPGSPWYKHFAADPVSATKELIQLEINASSRKKSYDVGPPISILRISRYSSGMIPGYEGLCPPLHPSEN